MLRTGSKVEYLVAMYSTHDAVHSPSSPVVTYVRPDENSLKKISVAIPYKFSYIMQPCKIEKYSFLSLTRLFRDWVLVNDFLANSSKPTFR